MSDIPGDDPKPTMDAQRDAPVANAPSNPSSAATPSAPSSSSSATAAPKAASRFSAAVATLNDYKELLTMILFVVGGVIWLYAAFATKAYVASIECLLGETIKRYNNDTISKRLSDELVDANIEMRRLEEIHPVDARAIEDIEKQKQKIDDLKSHKSLADQTAKSAENLQECKK